MDIRRKLSELDETSLKVFNVILDSLAEPLSEQAGFSLEETRELILDLMEKECVVIITDGDGNFKLEATQLGTLAWAKKMFPLLFPQE